MSEFEYLRYVQVGQYLPTGSWIHRLDPRARMLGTLALLAGMTLSTHLEGLALGLGMVVALLLAARIPLRYALRSLIPPLPFLLILVVLQFFFPPPGGPGGVLFQYGILRITVAGIYAGLALLVRFSGLVLAISLASYVISNSELIRGLEALLTPFTRIGLPTQDFVMMVQVMLRFLPFLAQAAERIAKAQASRGANWGTHSGGPLSRVRQSFPLLIPLFLNGLRRAEALALAMEARGYSNRAHHTSMLELSFRWRDGLAILCAVGLGLAVFFI
ncbi:MAG TPA: energy-coupling factor transporter transmembrane component T [Anaerolineaceae bacterium]|jgi:energy-coupling factor transport system permease protein